MAYEQRGETTRFDLGERIHETDWIVRDLNGDGRSDILFFPGAQNVFRADLAERVPMIALLRTSDGGFREATEEAFEGAAPTAFLPKGLAEADFDGDGYSDVFLADQGIDDEPFPGAPQHLALSGGDVMLASADHRIVGRDDIEAHDAAVGDIDGDGDIDAFVASIASEAPRRSHLLINDGHGQLTASTAGLPDTLLATYSHDTAVSDGTDAWLEYTYTATALFDADADGDLDLGLFASAAAEHSRVLLNDGSGAFDGGSIVLPDGRYGSGKRLIVDNDFLDQGTQNLDAKVVDLNGDGHLDIALLQVGIDLTRDVYYDDSAVQILINDGAGGFRDETMERAPSLGVGDGSLGVYGQLRFLDVDADGSQDIVLSGDVGSFYGQEPDRPLTRFFKNDGTGHFAEWSPRGEGVHAFQIPIPRADGGRADLLEISVSARQWDAQREVWLRDADLRLFRDTAGTTDDEADAVPAPGTIDLDGGTGAVDGTSGRDVGYVGAAREAYIVGFDGSAVTLQGAGTDVTLNGVERLAFSDGVLAFDPTAEEAYRLYRAAFAREPDAPGLGYWIGQLDAGADLQATVAPSFLNSDEFAARYGTEPTSETFIRALYDNVLGREADVAGLKYWVESISAGTSSRAGVLAAFAESAENVAAVADQLDDGVWYV